MRFGFGFPSRAVGGAAASVIPGLSPLLWLRADLGITETAGLVDAWTDQAGACTVFQTATARPAYSATSFNGREGVTFDGSSTYLKIAGYVYGQDCTVIAAVKPPTTSSRHTIFGNAKTSNNQGRAYQTSIVQQVAVRHVNDINGVTDKTSTGGLATASERIICWALDITSSQLSCYVNGADAGGNPIAMTPGTLTGVTLASLGVWARANYTNFQDWGACTIHELVAFNGILSAGNRAAVTAELTTRAGL